MNNELTNKEYLLQADEELKDIEIEENRKNKRLNRYTLAFILICVIVCITTYILSCIYLKNLYNDYVIGSVDNIDLKLLQYKDTYAFYEERHLGNSNNVLISGGYYAEKSGYQIFPNEDITDTLIQINGDTQSLCGELCSYINLIGEYVYFRKDSDRNVYRKSLTDGGISEVIDGNIGQFVITDNAIYFIDFEDDNSLYIMDLSTSTKEKIIENADSFAVFEDYVVCLENDNRLYLLNIKNNDKKKLCNNAERFFFNGNIIVQNNDSILLFNLTSSKTKRLDINGLENISLVSADKDFVYFQSNQTLYYSNTDIKSPITLCDGYNLYASVFRSENYKKIIAVQMNEDVLTKESLMIGN